MMIRKIVATSRRVNRGNVIGGTVSHDPFGATVGVWPGTVGEAPCEMFSHSPPK